jgi:hypothetical protein
MCQASDEVRLQGSEFFTQISGLGGICSVPFGKFAFEFRPFERFQILLYRETDQFATVLGKFAENTLGSAQERRWKLHDHSFDAASRHCCRPCTPPFTSFHGNCIVARVRT